MKKHYHYLPKLKDLQLTMIRWGERYEKIYNKLPDIWLTDFRKVLDMETRVKHRDGKLTRVDMKFCNKLFRKHTFFDRLDRGLYEEM